jgi:hypothetical protein
MILTTIGELPAPETNSEYIFNTFELLAGVLIFATVVGNVGSMISSTDAIRADFQHRLDAVKKYLAYRKVFTVSVHQYI